MFDQQLRKEGAGRKRKITDEVWSHIEQFIEPYTRGKPQAPLQWVSKSLRYIEAELKKQGLNNRYRIEGDSLKENGFSLQANRKTFEGKEHKDINAQFEFINHRVKSYFSKHQPVISVKAKKRELIGNYKNYGAEWRPKGLPEAVNAYDFDTDTEGVPIPYGIYDLKKNNGWVNIGKAKDTAEFVVQSIKN